MLKFESSSERAKYALEDAESNLKILKQATSLPFEKMAWLTFLTSVDGIRQSLIESYKGCKHHNKWYSAFANDMKSDELLIYMRNARNNTQHIVTKTPLDNQFGISVFDKNGKGFPMDSISSKVEGDTLHISLTSEDIPKDIELDADIYRLEATAMPVENKGKIYPPPKIHQNVLLASNKIIYLADLTLDYYKKLVEKAEELERALMD